MSHLVPGPVLNDISFSIGQPVSVGRPVLNRGSRPVLIAFSLAVILTLNNIYLPINIHSVSLRSTFFRATAITCPLFGIVYSPSPVLHLMHHGLAYASHLHSFALQPQHVDTMNRIDA